MEDQLRGQAQRLPGRVPSTGHSSNTRQTFNLSDIPALLSTANASLYNNRLMQQAPAILNYHSSSLPPSIRPSAVPAIPPFILSAQQYKPPAQRIQINYTSLYPNTSLNTSLPHPGHQNTQFNNTSQYTSLPHPSHPFLTPPPPPQQPRKLTVPATRSWKITKAEEFFRDQDALVANNKSRLAIHIKDAFATLEEVYPIALQIFTRSFDQLRDITASVESVPSFEGKLCGKFMVDDAIEGIIPNTGPGTDEAIYATWRSEYDEYQLQKSATNGRDLSMDEMFTIPIIPSPAPYHIHARRPLWQANVLRSLQTRRAGIVQLLRIIRDFMYLGGDAKEVFPFPEVGFGDAKRSFVDGKKENWPSWKTFMGGMEFDTCMKEEMEHWTKLWEAFNVEVEVAKRVAERKKMLGRLWGVSGEELELGETQNGTGAGRFAS
ncbi:hypothetical protein MMC30_008665 [Trapelia coarctata]|nr:hypothetical protein [Trapelia coarctata]